jgi:hypothetical protein
MQISSRIPGRIPSRIDGACESSTKFPGTRTDGEIPEKSVNGSPGFGFHPSNSEAANLALGARGLSEHHPRSTHSGRSRPADWLNIKLNGKDLT